MRLPYGKLLVLRLLLAVAVRTAFDPDEFWQGPEVAHRLVFGYGHLTWEWAVGLRSYLHPLLFTPGFWLLRVFALDAPWAVQLAPRLTQAFLSLAHDAAAAAFVHAHFPAALRAPAAVVFTASWFCAFVHTRTYSNALEATLYLAALAAWPIGAAHDGSGGKQRIAPAQRRRRRAAAIACAGLCCVLRPTAVVLFVPVAVWELALGGPGATVTQRVRHAATFLADGGGLAAAFLLANAAVDRAFYGRWVVPAWENFRQNVLQNVSAQYGEHPWHWYVTQGLPAMLATLLPLVAAGLWRAARRRCAAPLWPAALSAWGIAVYSAIPHKEFRFALPSFELLLPYAALPLLVAFPGISQLCGERSAAERAHGSASTARSPACAPSGAEATTQPRRRGAGKAGVGAAPEASTSGRPSDDASALQLASRPRGPAKRWSRWAVGALLAAQVPTLAYFGTVHQRGTIAAAEWIAGARFGAGEHVVFLTNCHATPWQSHFHAPEATFTFLDCSPPGLHRAVLDVNAPLATGVFATAEGGATRSEEHTVLKDPAGHLERIFGAASGAGWRPAPTALVMWGEQVGDVRGFLLEHGYARVASFLHNPAEGSQVVIWQRSRGPGAAGTGHTDPAEL